MTKLEEELYRMFGHSEVLKNAKFVGNACYGRLTDQIRVKISFHTGMAADHYDRLKVTLLNRNEGMIDSMELKFGDVWGRKKTDNSNFRDGIIPHLWRDGLKTDWYVYHPEKQDYRKLVDAVRMYLEVFQEPGEEERIRQKEGMDARQTGPVMG